MRFDNRFRVRFSDMRQDFGFMNGASYCDQISHIEIFKSMREPQNKISGGDLTKSIDNALILYMRNVEKTLTSRIREVLKRKDMTVVALSERSGIAQGYLNELMNLHPRKRWNITHITGVAEALDIPVWQLFIDPRDIMPSELIDFVRKYERLEGDNKRIVDALLATAKVDDKPATKRSAVKKSAT
jgi:transcriptional regulator with XRE-family HTH domain